MNEINFEQDQEKKPRGKAADYAYSLAMKIRDSEQVVGNPSASMLRNYYSIDTLLDAIDAINDGATVSFE